MHRIRSATMTMLLAMLVASPLATQAASPEPSPAASLISEPTAGVTVSVRAGGEPCRWELGCLAGITLTPVGSDVPALEGTIDPSADPSAPDGSLEATLAPGTYVASVKALGVTEPAAEGAPPETATTSVMGGCARTIELTAERPAVELTAAMAWDQPACGIAIEPAGPATPRPEVAQRIAEPKRTPRFTPRGAPTVRTTKDGIKLELWVQDDTLRPGQWLLAHLRASNVGDRVIRHNGEFEGLACPPVRSLVDTSDLFDPGLTWTGVAATYKKRFFRDGLLTRAGLSIPGYASSGGCSDIGQAGRLEPGDVEDMPLAGVPSYWLRDQPLPPGTIHLSVGFDGSRRADRVSVSTDVELAGDPVAYPSPGQLVDAALMSPGFIETLERQPDPRDWVNTNIAWWKKRPYPPQQRLLGARDAPGGILEVGLFFDDSDDSAPFALSAVIDPWTAESYGVSAWPGWVTPRSEAAEAGTSVAPASAVIGTVVGTAVPTTSPSHLPSGEPQVDLVRDERFELTLSTPRSVWTVGEPIRIDTTLAYVGSQPEITVTGSSSGLVRFRIDQLDGDLSAGSFMNLDRQPYQFLAGEVRSIPFDKGGGYTPGAPDAPFWLAWINDYDLRPPAGSYRITAELHYSHPSLGPDDAMPTATLVIDVQDDATASAEPSVPATAKPPVETWTSEGIKATSDLKAIAEANGWTIDQAKADERASQAVAGISGAVFEEQPDIYIGGALSEEPGGAPSLYIKGPAPQWVLDLVATAGGPIIVVDEQPYSFDELDARKDRVHQALVDAGYPNVATGVNITGGGVIPVSLLSVAGLPSDPEAILAFVPEELRADVQLDVTIAPPRPSAPPGTWGPLAVVYQPAGFGPGVGLGAVTLRIGEACVWTESKQGRYRATLVFEGDRVDWRPADRRIVFTDRRGATVRLSDGDRIEGGGASLWPPRGPEGVGQVAPTPEPGRRWDPSLDDAWLQEPDASCPERLFFLSEASVREDESVVGHSTSRGNDPSAAPVERAQDDEVDDSGDDERGEHRRPERRVVDALALIGQPEQVRADRPSDTTGCDGAGAPKRCDGPVGDVVRDHREHRWPEHQRTMAEDTEEEHRQPDEEERLSDAEGREVSKGDKEQTQRPVGHVVPPVPPGWLPFVGHGQRV